ncbi:hypothetical protein [Vibrio alginolyticus]|uniref:hypothetical protein n=1 Tax=Vibrio alginolyticus TaxID=663 RepID=UPI00215D078E|nr:hypothetical protein [Vibrio alginolyticus]MCR9321599.1 hypothetical protein [Vibrio alginolyticus]MCR9522699.1 hypothetical protein [Vibrio alginolyticus]
MINQLLLALGERKQLRPYIMTRAMDSSGGRLTDRDIHAYIVKEGLVSTIIRIQSTNCSITWFFLDNFTPQTNIPINPRAPKTTLKKIEIEVIKIPEHMDLKW